MLKLEEKELIRRAKKNYFDRNPNIQQIFVNEFGQFSYRQADLEEPWKHTEVKVFLITRAGLEALENEGKDAVKDEEKKQRSITKGLQTKAKNAEKAAKKAKDPEKKKDLEEKALNAQIIADEAQEKIVELYGE